MTTATPSHFPSKSRGRPREFDIDEALDKAIPVLCGRGYHGTSINDLADAMQLTVGSIYKAFKDKRGVFLAALDRQSSLARRPTSQSGRCSQVRARQAACGPDVLCGAVAWRRRHPGLSHRLHGRRLGKLRRRDRQARRRLCSGTGRRTWPTLLQLGQEDGSISKGYRQRRHCALDALRAPRSARHRQNGPDAQRTCWPSSMPP